MRGRQKETPNVLRENPAGNELLVGRPPELSRFFSFLFSFFNDAKVSDGMHDLRVVLLDGWNTLELMPTALDKYN